MNLGVLLPLGESLSGYAQHGQDVRFVEYYLKHYCRHFERVNLFSYEKENYTGLPKNCLLICPPMSLHRYLYGLILPFVWSQEYKQCDVFRCFHPSAAMPAIVGKLFFGKKFIFNYNYDYLNWAKVEGKSYLLPLLYVQQRLAFMFCDHVFVADEKMEKFASQYITKNKITLIRNGVDTAFFTPGSRKNKSYGDKTILSVGRLEKQKNYQMLIGAVAQLGSEIKLIIIGKGTKKIDLIKQAKKLKVNLQLIDVVPNDELPLYYRAADIYVQPSLMEAPVKTLLEAMSCALPCVASDAVGVKDVIEDGRNGLLAQLTVKDFTNKIQRLLDNKELSNQLGRGARQTVITKYDLIKFLETEVIQLKKV